MADGDLWSIPDCDYQDAVEVFYEPDDDIAYPLLQLPRANPRSPTQRDLFTNDTEEERSEMVTAPQDPGGEQTRCTVDARPENNTVSQTERPTKQKQPSVLSWLSNLEPTSALPSQKEQEDEDKISKPKSQKKKKKKKNPTKASQDRTKPNSADQNETSVCAPVDGDCEAGVWQGRLRQSANADEVESSTTPTVLSPPT